MKALVVGYGFIGRFLIKELKKNKITPIVIHHNQVHDFEKTPVDYIFYLAAYGNHYSQLGDIEKIYKANTQDLFDLLMYTRNVSYKGLVFVSTSSVMLPTQTMYSATKGASERLIDGFTQQLNLPIVSARPFSVYGEEEAAFRFIPTVIRSIVRDETFKLVKDARHDWIYGSDLASGLIACAKNAQKHKGEVFQIGTGDDVSNANIVHIIEQLMNKKAKYEAVESMRSFDTNLWLSESSKLEKLGWQPKVELVEGLKRTVDYYRRLYGR